MCRFQIALSECLRRLRYGDNSRNRAARLPDELYLHIFRTLRARSHFGSAAYFGHPAAQQGFSNSLVRAGLRDLAAARLVCRAWYFSATEALYAEVVLTRVKHCVGFADALSTHPRFASSVRCIRLPGDLWELMTFELAESREAFSGIRWVDLKDAVDRILTQCILLETLSIAGCRELMDGVIGLLCRSERIAHLSCWRFPFTYHADQTEHVGFDSSLMEDRLPPLQSLFLNSWTIQLLESARTLRSLRSLHIADCEVVDYHDLVAFLCALPDLRVFNWRRNRFTSTGGPLEAWIPLPELLIAHHGGLTSCTIQTHHDDAWQRAAPGMLAMITLDDVHIFVSLRTLAVSDDMLGYLTMTPPCLEELDVIFDKTTDARRNGIPWHKAVLYAVQCLKERALFWLAFSPSLQIIRFWDSVERSHIGMWAVISFLTRALLEPLGVDVVVNLTLSYWDEEKLREKFARQKHIRRLLWRDVL